MNNSSRRRFLAQSSAAVAVGATAASVLGHGEIASPKKRVVPGSPYPTFSRAVEFGGVVHVAGVLGQKPGTRDLVGPSFEDEAKQAMENIKASVEASGSSMEKVLKCGVFLKNGDDFAAFNKIYVTYFPKNPPARSTVIVKALVVPEARLEIDCIAHM